MSGAINRYKRNAEMQLQNEISKSDIFDILRNDRRRCALEILKKDGGHSLREISDEIARIESGEEDPTGKMRKSIYISLLQTHLPKMEEIGLITYNREMDLLELTPLITNMNVYLETVEKWDIPWSQYYVGISTVALFSSLLIVTGTVKFVTEIQWLLFVDMLFLISSVIHLVHMKKVNI